MILFVRYEDKVAFIEAITSKNGVIPVDALGATIAASISPDSLLYSWGNCRNGKLGISDDYFTEFVENE